MTFHRGLVVPLTPEQRRNRALYLAGELPIEALDVFVRKEHAPTFCPLLYYRLEYPNGGVDPTAPDPAARWSKPGSSFINRTLDCFAAACWCAGFDRVQPVRARHVWDGHLNCDSMLLEALGAGRCFEIRPVPERGDMVVYASEDYNDDGERDRVGHIETMVEVPAQWDPKNPACWAAIQTVGARGRQKGRANKRYNGSAFFGVDAHGVAKEAKFVRSIMKP